MTAGPRAPLRSKVDVTACTQLGRIRRANRYTSTMRRYYAAEEKGGLRTEDVAPAYIQYGVQDVTPSRAVSHIRCYLIVPTFHRFRCIFIVINHLYLPL